MQEYNPKHDTKVKWSEYRDYNMNRFFKILNYRHSKGIPLYLTKFQYKKLKKMRYINGRRKRFRYTELEGVNGFECVYKDVDKDSGHFIYDIKVIL